MIYSLSDFLQITIPLGTGHYVSGFFLLVHMSICRLLFLQFFSSSKKRIKIVIIMTVDNKTDIEEVNQLGTKNLCSFLLNNIRWNFAIDESFSQFVRFVFFLNFNNELTPILLYYRFV